MTVEIFKNCSEKILFGRFKRDHFILLEKNCIDTKVVNGGGGGI
jgi:hypothetical protein